MNKSKINDLRCWRQWYASGAVAQPKLSASELTIDAVGTTYANYTRGVKSDPRFAEGHDTLSLGQKLLNAGPGWAVYEPAYVVVVPANRKHMPGVRLLRLPGNAVPVDVFFAQ